MLKRNQHLKETAMDIEFISTHLVPGTTEPTDVLMMPEPESRGVTTREQVVLTTQQKELLGFLVQINGFGEILQAFARAGARLGQRL